MNKILKMVLSILSTAFVGALTIFSGTVFMVIFVQIADKFLNNNIVGIVIFCIILIAITMSVGWGVKEKWKRG